MVHQVTLSDVSPDAILARHGKSFHWARHLLGRVHGARATRLYAFCRQIDDIVDHAVSSSEAEHILTRIKWQIKTTNVDDKWLQDICDLMRECKIDNTVVIELIDGITSDLTHVPFTDQNMLLRYCYRVAGTVGLMMCRVLDVSDEAAHFHAIDLGIGMQLTNICRDIGEDAALGRRYIPATMIGDIHPGQLINSSPEKPKIIARSIEQLLTLANRYYESGESGLAYLPLRARLGIHVAGKIYQAIGNRLRQRHYAYWQGRATVGIAGKSLITLRALTDFLVVPALWQLPHQHDHTLHTSLHGLPYTHIYGFYESSN